MMANEGSDDRRARFKSKAIQGVYDTCLKLAADLVGGICEVDDRLLGRDLRDAFLDGARGVGVKHRIASGTPLHAAYLAGREFARKGGKVLDGPLGTA